MRKLRAIWLRFLAMILQGRANDDIADELDSHIDLHIADGVRAGLSPDEARRQALIRLGGAEQVKQAWRERRGAPWLEAMGRDLRFGLRMLLKNPGFTSTAVVTLALGIGANTAIFGLADSFFFKPLAVAHPEQLVRIFAKGPSGHYGAGFSMPEFDGLRQHVTSLAAASAETHIAQLNVASRDGTEEVSGAFVSANYFDVLGVQPALGRTFFPAEDAVPNRDAVAIIGDGLWKAHFHADRAILGREMRVNSTVFMIIGVAPPGFHGDKTGSPEELWMPSMMIGKVGFGCSDSTYHCSMVDAILARLAPSQSLAAAQAEARSRIVWSATDWPEHPSARQIAVLSASGEWPDERSDGLPQMRLLLAVTASLLLIVCANLAGLLLARGVTRRREIAVRMAIGARRGRVVRQLLTESLLLALLSGACGAGASIAFKRLLSRFYETDSEGFHHLYDLSLDWRTLAYSFALTLILGVLFALIPAIRGSRQNLVEELKSSGTASQPETSRWLQLGLVAGQIALSMVLTISAALLVRSGTELERGTNFDPVHIAVFRLRPELLKYSPLQVKSLLEETRLRLSASPGVESVAFMEGGEGLVWNWQNGRDAQVSLPGQILATPHAGLTVHKQDIGASFFRTLRTPMLQGREFDSRDRAGSPRVAIVNEALAQRLWPAGKAAGSALVVDGQRLQVTGVAADLQPASSAHAPEPHVYLCYWQSGAINEGDIRMAVRVSGDPALALDSIRRVIRSIDPEVPIGEDMPMAEQVSLEYTPVRLARTVLSYCGLLALCLSSIGLYSILAFAVRTRTREIGVRMALGARRGDVLRLIVAQGTRLALTGVVFGVAAAFILTRLEASLLFGVDPRDPFTFCGVAVLLFLVTLAACYLPARRAASIDPMQALRME
jgi:macrolide transport system ATP-binding/permease protein